MTESQVLDILARVGAILQNGHFVYTSGRHGNAYVNKDALYPHTELVSSVCQAFAQRFVESDVEVCLAPALGGIILSQWTAFHLTRLHGREILSVYAEKAPTGDGFVLKRGYDQLVANKRVLVLEDILTTGISVKRTIETARAAHANVVGVAALCNRGGLTIHDLDDVPVFHALTNVALDSWSPEECPLCKKGIPVNTQVGKGKTL